MDKKLKKKLQLHNLKKIRSVIFKSDEQSRIPLPGFEKINSLWCFFPQNKIFSVVCH